MTMANDDDRQKGQGIRRRQGGRTSIYHDQLYPSAAVAKNTAPQPCDSFEPASGDPGHCANCGHYDGDHDEVALGEWASGYYAGIPGSDSSTGAY